MAIVLASRVQIAFIGGTRFIGHAAAEVALERGHVVTLCHRGKHPCEVKGAKDVLVDRRDPEALALTLKRAEIIVDTRALTRPDAEVSALCAKILEVPCVVLSSQDVYAQFGRLLGHPMAEAPQAIVTEQSPLTVPYPFRGIFDHEGGPDYDKKQVEAVFEHAKGLPGAIALRLPAVYGARDPNRRFAWVLDALGQSDVLPCQGGGTWRWTHAHVRDAAQAVVLAAENAGPGYQVFNVGEAHTPTMRERVEAIAGHLGKTVRFEEVEELPEALEDLGRHDNDIVVSSEAVRRALGFEEITTAEERIADLVGWLRKP